jgi:hypothetical protein
VPFGEIAPVLNPAPRDRWVFVLLTFYADESYNNRTFNFGGWLARESVWSRLESQWGRRLDFERRRHGKLERFHATHCNGGAGDYEGWGPADRVKHTKSLLDIVKRRKELVAVCAGLDVEAMRRVYPGDAKDWRAGAYRLTVTQLMIMVARTVKKNSGHRVAIIHDWANEYNVTISDAFTAQQENPKWAHRDLFISCTPMKWQDRIALQSADMIAFDTFKLLDGTTHSTPRMRRSLQALLDGQIPVLARYIGEPALLRLREISSKPSGNTRP